MYGESDRRMHHNRRVLRQLDETLVLLTLYEVGTFDALLEGRRPSANWRTASVRPNIEWTHFCGSATNADGRGDRRDKTV